MSDKDIFTPPSDGNDPKPKDETLDKVVDLFADKLLAIKKEDGTPKYDTLDKALDALKASQEHIPTLENDNRSLRTKIEELTVAANRAAELEEIVRRMSNGQNNEEKPKVDTPPVGGLSADDAATLVKNILKQEKQTETAVQNVRNVQDKLVAKFGDKAAETIASKAKELGVTTAQLKELSATSPAMVLALFGDATSTPSTTTSSVNLGGLKPPVTKVERPEKSLLSGLAATDKNRADLMRKIKEDVHKRLNITS